jgi:hypothetical protein
MVSGGFGFDGIGEDTRALIAATRQQITSRSTLLEYRKRMESTRTTKKWIEISDEIVEVLRRRLAGLEESFQRAFPGEEG